MKRDIKINYGALEDFIHELGDYLQSIETMKAAVLNTNALIQNSKGEAVEALKETYQGTLLAIESYYENIAALRSLIIDYIQAMTRQIRPLARYYMTRADSNDTYWNINSINTSVHHAYLTDSYLYRDPSDTEDESWKFLYLEEEMAAFKRKAASLKEELWDLHQKVANYEETDDNFVPHFEALYRRYTNSVERTLDEWAGFFSFIGSAFIGVVAGCWELIAAAVQFVLLAGGSLCYIATKSLGIAPGLNAYVERSWSDIAAFFEDPLTNIAAMANHVADDFDKDPAFAIGSLVPGAALFFVPGGALAKAVKITKPVDNLPTGVVRPSGVAGAAASPWKVVDSYPAERANAWWTDTAGYGNSPYKPGTVVSEIVLEQDTRFVRVYDGDTSRMAGGWMMIEEDIAGLSAAEIRDLYSLPNTPLYLCDVEIPAGATLRTGITNEVPGWGSGGGVQFDLMGQRVGEFTNERTLD
jgi:uncharacterized protein YukE